MKKRKNLKTLFLFNGLLFVIALILIQYSVVTYEDDPVLIEPSAGLNTPVLQGVVKDRFTSYPTPEPMPEFDFKTVFGREMSFDDLMGQWVIVNLWATWCPPCIVEMPSLQKFQNKYAGQGVKVVAISLDRNMNADKLKTFNNRQGFGPIAAYFGDGQVAMKLFAMRGLPTTYIVEPGGRAVGYVSGDIDWMSEEAIALMDSLLQ